MINSIKLNIPVFVIVVSLFNIDPAQSQSGSKDSLLFYLELAAKNNPTVLQRFSEYRAALQKVLQVGSLPDPELNAGVFLSPMELVEGRQIADIRLMQMFPWFKTLSAAKDEMSLMAKAKYELLRDAKLQVFYDVQRTWYELYKNNKDIDISNKNIEILRTLERLALVKFKAAATGSSTTPSGVNSVKGSLVQSASSVSSGMQSMSGNAGNNAGASINSLAFSMQNSAMGSQPGGSGLADLYRVQIEIGDLENNIALLQNQRNIIVALFNSYLNRPVQSPVAINILRPDTLEVSLPIVSDSMLIRNPMLVMLQYEQQSLEARHRMVTRMGYPMVGIGVNYSLINKSKMSESPMNGKDMIMPMVAVTLPIYRKKYKAMQSEAGLLKTATEQNYTATSNALRTEYYQAVLLYQDAQRRMNLYSNQYLLADKTLDIMLKSFSTAGGSLTDILRIRQQTLDYELKQVDAMVDFNTAIAWLKRLMAFSQTE